MPTKAKRKREKKVEDRQPMGLHVALSAWQLNNLEVPEHMTEDDLSEALDRALLNDDNAAFRDYIREWAEENPIA